MNSLAKDRWTDNGDFVAGFRFFDKKNILIKPTKQNSMCKRNKKNSNYKLIEKQPQTSAMIKNASTFV